MSVVTEAQQAWEALPARLVARDGDPARDAVVIVRLPAGVAPAVCYLCREPAVFGIGYYGPNDGPAGGRTPGVALLGGSFYGCSLAHASAVISDPPRADSLFPVAPKLRAEWCSCGRPALQVLAGGQHGPTGFCGVPGNPPLDPCDCAEAWRRHDRSVCHIYGLGMAS